MYRASNFPSLQGYYFYGDYCSGRIWALHYDADIPAWITEQSARTPTYNISSFGEDESGQVYFTDRGQGRVLRLGYQDPAGVRLVQSIPGGGLISLHHSRHRRRSAALGCDARRLTAASTSRR